ncbi:hypothetical protein KM043_011484 [Ampulex compressa]|nr:hypothetical protein KM043_011484 [Ampulex compressa]
MPIKYIGRTTNFKGKTLWEILGNLKNYGVGRMVIRYKFQRYPEVSYMRILKVAALPGTDDPINYPRKVVALVERTFRGKVSPKPVQIQSASYKADYQLIPKDEEYKFTSGSKTKEINILPREIEFPPVFKLLVMRANAICGDATEDPKMLLRYNKKSATGYRCATEEETPTINITHGIDTSVRPSLYANIKKSYQECAQKDS